MKTPYFIEKIDWNLLNNQKSLLTETINNDAVTPKHKEALEGILSTLDAIQDYAVDQMGLSEELVFNNTNNNTILLCDKCNSDNIQIKHWVNPNNNQIHEQLSDDIDDFWCEDCETHSGAYLSEMRPTSKIIGFQVVGENENDGKIHPLMEGSFCVYSLSQANEMLSELSNNWKLLTVWNGDIEEPTMMFNGDMRN